MTAGGFVGANIGGGGGAGSGSILQSIDAVAASFSSGSGTYVQRLSQGITMSATGILLLDMTASFSLGSTNRGFFRVRINGTTYRSGGCCSDTEGGNVAITGRVAVGASSLVAGANTITVDARVTGNTMVINPATDGEGLFLRLIEVAP